MGVGQGTKPEDRLIDDLFDQESNESVERRKLSSPASNDIARSLKYSEAVVLRMKKIIFTQDIFLVLFFHVSLNLQRPSVAFRTATRPSPSELPSPAIPTERRSG